MSDLISRAEAIDGFYEMASDIDHLCTVGDYILFLESLSAQPERHGVLIEGITLPRKGCYHCMFREGNLCKFLPASVPVVECGARHERHKECPLVEV